MLSTVMETAKIKNLLLCREVQLQKQGKLVYVLHFFFCLGDFINGPHSQAVNGLYTVLSESFLQTVLYLLHYE